jgi:hypothetical protein
MKDALLARYSQMRPSTSFIESLKLPPQVLADIWLPVPFPPVSFEPLSDEEMRAVRLGHFGASGKNHRHEHAGSSSSGNASGGSDRYGRRFQAQPAGNGPRDIGSQGGRNRQMGQSRSVNRREVREEEGFGGRGRNDADDVIEDPDNLWAFPSTPGAGDASSFGCFDENGVFCAESASSEPNVAEAPPPVTIEPPAAPPRATAAAPTITPETNWFYRDPSGHFQGPFSSVRMLDWYNGGYFPESLPLRREQDAFFEPLSVWKMKCGGQIPFSAYSKAPAEAKDLFSGFRAVEEVFSLRQTPKTGGIEKALPEAVPANVPRSVAVEALFGGARAVSPTVLMPTPSAAVTAKAQQQSTLNHTSLQQIEDEMVAKLKVSLAPPVSEPVLQKSWSVPSGPAATKPVSLAEIMQQQHHEPRPEPAKHVEAALTEERLVSAANAAGWAKISSPTAGSLADIIHAESARARDEQQRHSSTASTPSSSSKSFADLVRAAGQVGGNIVVAPGPGSASTSLTACVQPISQPVVRKSVLVADKEPASVSEGGKTAVLHGEGPSIEEWCLQALSRSPLKQDIDPATCSTLLLELPSASAILAFSAENLQPLLSREKAFDLAGFSSELAARKFGKSASASVNWSRLSVASPAPTAKVAAPAAISGDFSFETVRRKKK